MLSVVRLAPARGVIVEVKALEDWTKIVMRAPTIIAKYLVSHPSPRIGISALITFSITLLLMCSLELKYGNPDMLECAHTAARSPINNHCNVNYASYFLIIYMTRSIWCGR